MNRIKPANENELADVVRGATAPFEIVSGGTKRGYGRPSNGDTILDTSAISGIVNYEPEELVLRARAGTRIAEIEAALLERNQMLGFSPADWGALFAAGDGRATIGGVAAANACGARRLKAGAVRDHIIGCRFVNGAGEIVKAGGPVIKNVTGFDIARLMCGAFGTLGVLVELTLRVTPAAPNVGTLAICCDTGEGFRALREAAKLPLDPTGLAYLPAAAIERCGVAKAAGLAMGAALIRIEGAETPVKDKLVQLGTYFGSNDKVVLDDDTTRALFRAIDNGAFFAGRDEDIWRLCVPVAEAHAALEASGATVWYADWAGGLLWLDLPATEDVALRLRTLAARLGGHATLMRASPTARATLSVFEPETPARAALTRSVKSAFDSRRLFNPGRMYENV